MESVFSQMENGYRLNNTYPCYCHQHLLEDIGCNLWRGSCYLNLEATQFVMETQMVYRYGSDAAISIGCLLFLAICIGGIVMVVRSKRKADQFVFVMTDKE